MPVGHCLVGQDDVAAQDPFREPERDALKQPDRDAE